MADREGQQLGNYRIIRLLGRGGFADVYLGEHIYLKTPVAIKLLQTKVVNKEDLDSFLKEAQTIARLVHPNIVRVLDFGVDAEMPFLVMDYAANGTLRQRHPRGTQLPLTTIVPYVKQVAEALQHAHDEKLIHRDIKPENMLLGRRNEVLLSDFGIALIAQSSRYQSTQDVVGTVAYMSPEQIQGKPRPASDQYSLGIVVYEWLSGDRPFHGSFTELCTQHMFATPPPLHEKIPTIPGDVEQVVLTALAKEPPQRFARVQAFATALEQASLSEQPASEGVLSQPPSVVPTTPSESLSAPGVDLPPSRWPQPTVAAPQPNQQAQATTGATPSQSQWAQPTEAPPPRSHETQSPMVTPPSNQPPLVTPSPSQRVQPTAVQPPQRPVTEQPKEERAPSESQTEKVNVWRIGKRQIVAMIVGIILYGSLSHFFIFVTGSPSLIVLIPATVILLFFGVAFGPWVGLFTGVVGSFLGDYFPGPVFLLYSNNFLIISFFHSLFWGWYLSFAVIGFIAGLTLLSTQGRYNNIRNFIIADIISAAGTVICFTLVQALFNASAILRAFPNETLPNTILGLILLPILLLIYNAITSRIKRT